MNAHQKVLPLRSDSLTETRVVSLLKKQSLTDEGADELRFLEDYLKWKNRNENFPRGEPSLTTIGPGQRKPRRPVVGAGGNQQ